MTQKLWEVDCPLEQQFGMDGNKWRIFCCTVHYFAKQDYSSVSMRKIADEVGIKASSIYNHFPSKDAILSQMYDTLEAVILCYRPNMDELLLQAETQPLWEVLKKINCICPEPLYELASKMLLATSKLIRTGPRADQLLRKQLVEIPQLHITSLLSRLVELERIAPLDIAAFSELYVNNYYSASMRLYSSHAVDTESWNRSFDLLFNMVQPLNG